MFMTWVILCFILLKTVASEADLQHQNHEHINPVNDYQQEQTQKEQDKRTIFPNNHGWAKHVGVHPSGFKYILGYGPVELKYVPIVKPISIKPHIYHHPHHIHKLKYHIRHPSIVVKPLLPVRPVVHHDGWKPVVPIVKPVAVPVQKPWPQEVWSKPVHIHHPVTVVKPAQSVVPIKPVPVQPVVPLKPVHVHYPVKPIIPSKPLIPLPQPVGTTVLQQIPISPELFYPHHHHHHLVPVNQVPVAAPAPPVVFPQVVPQPIVPVHLHPHLHHTHIHAESPHVHHQVPHVHHQIPHEQHDVQTPLIPHNHPIFQQQIPNHLHPHAHLYAHQHPHIHPDQHPELALHHHVPHLHQVPVAQPEIYHQHDPHVGLHHHPPQVPLEQHPQQIPQTGPTLYHETVAGGVQHHFNQQIQHGEGATSNIVLQGSIQPGHTDLQIPEHLPLHPNYLPEDGRQFQPGNFHDPTQHPDVVRPGIGLEPPFTHKK